MGGQECPSKDRLDGQTIVVVDGTDAVSSEVIRECCARGAAHIILGCCDVNDGQAAVEQLKDVYADIRFTVKQLNLSEIDSIHEFSQTIPKEVEKIDLLVNNTRNLAAEQQIFRGSFALIFSLLPVLRKSTNGRVVNVVNETFSTVGFGDFDATANATGDGKSCGVGHLALLAATKWIAMKSKGMKSTTNGKESELIFPWLAANKSSVTINACTIGTIRGECGSSTEALIGKWLKFPFDWILKKTPKQGAQTIIYLSVAEQVRNMSGELFT